jgi:hypothetical protein
MVDTSYDAWLVLQQYALHVSSMSVLLLDFST